jgi:hypothetical protein
LHTGPALRVGNRCHDLRPIIFRAQNILLYLPTIIENKKSIIFKERKHTIIKKNQLYLRKENIIKPKK